MIWRQQDRRRHRVVVVTQAFAFGAVYALRLRKAAVLEQHDAVAAKAAAMAFAMGRQPIAATVFSY